MKNNLNRLSIKFSDCCKYLKTIIDYPDYLCGATFILLSNNREAIHAERESIAFLLLLIQSQNTRKRIEIDKSNSRLWDILTSMSEMWFQCLVKIRKQKAKKTDTTINGCGNYPYPTIHNPLPSEVFILFWNLQMSKHFKVRFFFYRFTPYFYDFITSVTLLLDQPCICGQAYLCISFEGCYFFLTW